MTTIKSERILVSVYRYEVKDNTIADTAWRVAYRTFKSLNAAERFARQAQEAARGRYPGDYVEAALTGLVYYMWDWHEVWNGWLRYDDDIEYVDAETNSLIARPA